MLRNCVLLIVLIVFVSSAASAQVCGTPAAAPQPCPAPCPTPCPSVPTTTIPRYTVIPVTMSSQLSSATANVGDMFSATVSGARTCCFVQGTCIAGKVVKVIRANGRRAGQIVVTFTSATFPDGTCVKIRGALVALVSDTTCPNPNARCMSAISDERNSRNSFIAGPNCSVWVGVLCRGNVLLGDSINVSTICPPAPGAIRAAAGQDVVVTCGAEFGVMLQDPACIPCSLCNPNACGVSCPTATCVAGAGPGAVKICFPPAQPFSCTSSLMIPVKTVMAALCIPYTFDQASGMLTFNTPQGMITHKIGTNIITVCGVQKQICGFSGMVGDNIYIPADAITVATGRTVTWDAKTGNLQIN